MFSAHDVYQTIKKELKEAGIESYELDARFFMKSIKGVKDIDFLTKSSCALNEEHVQLLKEYAGQRIKHVPVDRILGKAEFWGLPFYISPDVLSPRPETELIVERALETYLESEPKRVLDLGTGSGCILISLLKEWETSTGVGVDISDSALKMAKKNAALNLVEDRCTFIKSDWGSELKESFDLIVSNPPYIPNLDIESLAKEVKNHDPILALDGGFDGLQSYKKIFLQILSLLKPSGIALFEIGINQQEDIMRIVEESGVSVKRINRDLAGIPRVVEISCGDK
jgi:release factor glutamine methyltransferase